MTLNHIHLGTKDLKKSVEFYQSVFGFQKKFDHGSGIFIENEAGFLIAIDPVDEVPNFPSWYHLGFCLPSEQEALEMHQKCKSLNVKIVRDLMYEKNQFASFFITDPDETSLKSVGTMKNDVCH
jgi:catechol 2,3-dioxygenase-like lactoylglutathione lyase family enzyme